MKRRLRHLAIASNKESFQGQKIKPIFFVGAQKSGTSYLFNLIKNDSSVAQASLNVAT